jgi:acyl-CoA dehydrogenase
MIRDQQTLDAFVSTVRDFVQNRLVPAERTVGETDRIPEAILAEMKAMGLYGLSIPEAYGGLGFTVEEEVILAFELGQTSPAFRSAFGTNIGIGSQALVMDGTEAQRAHYLPRMATGELIGSFALTEPEAGSDAASVKTTADPAPGGYRLNGSKRYITNAPTAGVFTVMARTDRAKAGAAGVTAFIVDAKTPGLSIGQPERKMGQQGAHVADVVFTDCFVPADAVIGGHEGKGFATAMKVLDRGRLHIAAICVGVAKRLIRESVRYALERRQFGKPIAEFQLIQAMIADSQADTYAAECMVRHAAQKRDRGEPTTMEAAAAKMFASEMVGRVADRAVQIFGGSGYIADYGIERFYRDVRLFRLYEGTTQIQQIIIARETLKREA